METIESLLAQGYIVRFHHYRRWRPTIDPNVFAPVGVMRGTLPPEVTLHYELDARGGFTQAEIRTADGSTLIGYGEAYCSDQDTFCKRIGRTKALGRAVSQFLLTAKAVH